MNLTAYRARKGAARARLRIERAQAEVEPEPKWKAPKLPRLPFIPISIGAGKDRRTFRVIRYDAKRFLALGKIQAASTIGKRIALVLEALL